MKIIFDKKDITKDEVKDIISKITDTTDFDVIIISRDDNTVTVIIKFDDVIDAKNFVDAVEAASNKDNFIFDIIGFLPEVPLSFTAQLVPLTVQFIFMFMFTFTFV